MLKQFEVNIHKNALFTKSDKLLVAFSGGVDSVVLAVLLNKAGYNFELAHCNFMLRGNEANDDTKFCENFAETLNCKIHTVFFDTKQYAQQHKLSVQMAARQLRYNWFNDLKQISNYNYILTAHHANDNVETVFVNLIRGTGIKGMCGIPQKQNDVIRPLLFATKQSVLNYATKHSILYREDSSNAEVKYKRNFLRHNIIPELKKFNPTIEETINTSSFYFKQAANIVADFADQKFSIICKTINNQLHVNIHLLLAESQKETLLFEWLRDKNFKSTQIIQLINLLIHGNFTGKQFVSQTHQLIVDREFIIIKTIENENKCYQYTIQSVTNTNHLPINLNFNVIDKKQFSASKNEILIELTANLFPLTLRKWQTGDKFKPFGMLGFKKLSDFFKDEKLNLFEKQQVWILESNKQIIWIINYRLDERFRINNDAINYLKITTL